MDRFSLRRAVERLRDGLFDQVAVDCLTVKEDRIAASFAQGLEALDRGQSEPLCICGSYGQGKSHALTYLHQLALAQGYATSVVSLDAREVPFHQFPLVYRAIMQRLVLPDGEKLINAWKRCSDKNLLELVVTMPHRFRMVLIAMLSPLKRLAPKKSLLKKNQEYHPREYGQWLDRALMGYNVPLMHLKNPCKYREVEGCREQSLLCRGNDAYFQMVQALGTLLKEMGYKGLVLFFDEAESIAQGRLSHRVKSYHLLDQFFHTHSSVFPLFAFTNDFFDQVKQESYDDSQAIFPKNYWLAWRDLTIVHLQDLSSHGWESLLERLVQLYAQAYQVDLSPQVKLRLRAVLGKLEGQETRYKLKALVNTLDIATQAGSHKVEVDDFGARTLPQLYEDLPTQ